tara:strand:+ start:128150 stop:128671 length:522 start_codon:yes stop_codon:yes gene_type:complete
VTSLKSDSVVGYAAIVARPDGLGLVDNLVAEFEPGHQSVNSTETVPDSLLSGEGARGHPFTSPIKSPATCRRRQAGYLAWQSTRTQMEITNKTRRPIKVPLPEGKKLFLGPGKSGQVHAKAANHPPVKELLEAGDLELGDDDKKRPASSDGSSSPSGNQNSGPTGNIRRTGDR